MQSKLKVMDNSGARIVQCIKSSLGSTKNISQSGDYILVSVKKLRFIRKVKRGEMYPALIVYTQKEAKFKDGSFSKFNGNGVVLLNKKKRLLSTRIFGFVSRNLRKKKFLRILLLAGQNLI